MKRIELTKGKFALVDDEDFEWLNQFKWYISDSGYALRRVYIRGSGRKNQKGKTIRMHCLINNTPSEMITDHIDRNRLNNQRSNLRVADYRLNGINRGKQKNNTSGHKGICWNKSAKKWMAEIKCKKKIYLGIYEFIEDAIIARKKVEKIYHNI